VAWLGFLGLAIWKSQSVSFSGLEFLALAVAIGISIFCVAKPLGGPKVDLSEPAHMLGGFEPEHMPMHDRHGGTQPPGHAFQARANQLLCGTSVGRGQGISNASA
jgi:hypothetical protein